MSWWLCWYLKDVFHYLLHFRLVMTIKPINRTKGVLSPANSSVIIWYYILNQTMIQNSQVVKKKLVEAILVHNSRTKMFPDMSFLQNDTLEQYLKNNFQRNLMIKLSRKLLNFIGLLFHRSKEIRTLLKIKPCHFFPYTSINLMKNY